MFVYICIAFGDPTTKEGRVWVSLIGFTLPHFCTWSFYMFILLILVELLKISFHNFYDTAYVVNFIDGKFCDKFLMINNQIHFILKIIIKKSKKYRYLVCLIHSGNNLHQVRSQSQKIEKSQVIKIAF